MRTDLAALVGSRICHDLISPLGAIGNGVELMTLTDGNTDAEMALIAESVENANARIRFFRIAYGSARTDQMVSRNEVLSVLAASARGGRFTYFWQVDGDQPRRDVRLAFLMLQCFESAFPLGGDIHVNWSGGEWELSAIGERMKIDADLWTSITKARTHYDHSASQVQFALLPPALADARRTLSVDFGENRVDARF